MKIAGSILLILALIAAYMVFQNLKKPATPGLINGQLAPLPSSPNAVSSQTENTDRYVEPFPFKADSTTTMAALHTMLGEFDSITILSETEKYIHAVSISAKMRYRDDLEFLLDEEENLVHFRSASRVGYSDMGLNRQRYNVLKERYNAL